MIAVGARHRLAPVRADEMRKSETQAELRGERAAVVRGAEQPRLGRGVGGDAGDENLGTGIGERRDSVVLGQPVTVVAELLGEPGEGNRFCDRFGGAVSADDGGLVEHPQRHPHPPARQSVSQMTPPTSRQKKNVSPKMPRMRALSSGVKPSFFFVAKWYSITMRAIPTAKTIPIHLYAVFTAAPCDAKRAVYRTWNDGRRPGGFRLTPIRALVVP